MNSHTAPLQPEAEELLVCPTNEYICETYIFEPSVGEESMGFLFAVGEVAHQEGGEKELLDTVITAIQTEYYRDTSRSPALSFETALHQGNLILHDTAASGTREWMNYFNVAIGILVKSTLHMSIAGEAHVLIARKGDITNVSEGLSKLPIETPLEAFSQVASGEVLGRDTIFFASRDFRTIFDASDAKNIISQKDAPSMTSKLKNLYEEQGHAIPLALITTFLAPQHTSKPSTTPAAATQDTAPLTRNKRASGVSRTSIQPRQAIIVKRSAFQKFVLLTSRALTLLWHVTSSRIWPALRKGSRQGRKAIAHARTSIKRNVGQKESSPKTSYSPKYMLSASKNAGTTILQLPLRITAAFSLLPKTSKIFAATAGILAIALIVSLVFLRSKRIEDEEFQRASEMLHEAQTKVEAAKTAIVYDNRAQAQGLLDDSQTLLEELLDMNVYADDVHALQQELQAQHDRMQRISRAEDLTIRTVGDFREELSSRQPSHIFFLHDTIYTFDPSNNIIAEMDMDGNVSVVHQTTEGVGYITGGIAHEADRTIALTTNSAGIAVFDARDNTMQNKEMDLPEQASDIDTLAVFGNRLYVYSKEADNIFVYDKTLRGFSRPRPWIDDDTVPTNDIVSIAIDSNIFTLHENGTIRKMFRGNAVDFTVDEIEPPLSQAREIITTEAMQNLYVFDPESQRIIILTKNGSLIRQVHLEQDIAHIAPHPDETKLYVLDGTTVNEISLVD